LEKLKKLRLLRPFGYDIVTENGRRAFEEKEDFFATRPPLGARSRQICPISIRESAQSGKMLLVIQPSFAINAREKAPLPGAL